VNFFQSATSDKILSNPLVLLDSKVTHCTAQLSEGTEEQIRDFYGAVAKMTGSLVRRNEDYRNGNVVGHDDEWIDIVFEESKKKESFRFSDAHQPLHTDGAYVDHQLDLSFLCCITQAELGGDTIFIDGEELFRIIEKYEACLLKGLLSVDVLFDKGEQQSKKSKIMSIDSDGVILNWNYYRVSLSNTNEAKELCDAFQLFLEQKILRAGLCKPVKMKKGEAVFFFDQRVLHGRNSFFGHRKLIKGGLSLASHR